MKLVCINECLCVLEKTECVCLFECIYVQQFILKLYHGYSASVSHFLQALLSLLC